MKPPRLSLPGVELSTQVSGSRYFFVDAPGRGGVRPAYGGFERCDPDYVVRRAGFRFPTIELVVSGRGWAGFGGRAVELGPGTLYGYDPRTGFELRADPAQPMAKYFLCLAGTGAAARLRAAGWRPGRIRRLGARAEVVRAWDELLREGRARGTLGARVCAALTEVLLLKIEEALRLRDRGPDAAADLFLRCKMAIDAAAPSVATLADLTRLTGVGASRLHRLFRRFGGESPIRYLGRRRMEAAAEHLLEPGCLVKEAAARVGFDDPYHFSRCFKRVHGVSPRGFRRERPRA